MKNIIIILLIFIMAIAIGACQARNPVSQGDLEGNTWLLLSYDGNQPVAGSKITLQFTGAQVSGSAGCNQYGGTFQTKGDTIRFSDIYATEMYCMDPAGVMDQEQSYLAALSSVESFKLASDVLTITTGADTVLIFEKQQASTTPIHEPSDDIFPTPTVVEMPPTVQPVYAPPEGFKEVQDTGMGISIDIPESWLVTGVISGQYAILQSYPVDKYIGGEMRDPADTKCDLNLPAADVTTTSYLQQLKSSPTVSVISEQEFTFQSGVKGMRLEIDSLGRSVLFVADLNHTTIALSCFGDFAMVDEIASTLRVND